MKTLDEYNKGAREIYKTISKNKAYVLCPKCKENGKDVEMEYTNPGWVNTVYPPTYTVHCPECKYSGYKVM